MYTLLHVYMYISVAIWAQDYFGSNSSALDILCPAAKCPVSSPPLPQYYGWAHGWFQWHVLGWIRGSSEGSRCSITEHQRHGLSSCRQQFTTRTRASLQRCWFWFAKSNIWRKEKEPERRTSMLLVPKQDSRSPMQQLSLSTSCLWWTSPTQMAKW